MTNKSKNFQIKIDFNNMMKDFVGEKEGFSYEEVFNNKKIINNAFNYVKENRGTGMMGWTELPYNQSEIVKDIIETASHHVGDKDYKTVLQEKLQVNGDVNIVYTIIKEEGPDHNKIFTAKLECDGKELALGKGRSKKLAEMEAARIALENF